VEIDCYDLKGNRMLAAELAHLMLGLVIDGTRNLMDMRSR